MPTQTIKCPVCSAVVESPGGLTVAAHGRHVKRPRGMDRRIRPTGRRCSASTLTVAEAVALSRKLKPNPYTPNPQENR